MPYKDPVISREKGRIRTAAYRARNPERVLEQSRRHHRNNLEKRHLSNAIWRSKNKDKIKADFAKWRKKNIDHESDRNAQYHSENKDARLAKNKQWRKENPEKRREINARYRARKIGTACEDSETIVKWEKSWKSKPRVTCYWCMIPQPSSRCHSDHIIALKNGGTHEIGNLCISCQPCNLRKSAKPICRWNSQIQEPVLL